MGDEPGLSECNECSDGLLLSDPSEGAKCECMPVDVGEVIMMFGLSFGSSSSFGKAMGTENSTSAASSIKGRAKNTLAMRGENLRDDVIEHFRDVRQSAHLVPLCVQGLNEPAVVVSHLRQLCSNLPWKLYTLLQGRVGFEGFPLDLLEKVRTAAEEFVM